MFDGYTDGQTKAIIDGFMEAGDVGHLDSNGLLFVDGRDDDMIVSGGENVFPSEVEDVIARHPDVREVAVVGVPDDEFGASVSRPSSCRVPAPSSTPSRCATYVRANAARYKVPRDVAFVDALPRNTTGKLVKRDLDEA